MFETDRLIEDCRSAAGQNAGAPAVREVVARAVFAHADGLAGLGAPTRSEIKTLYRGPDLTVLNVIWGPRVTSPGNPTASRPRSSCSRMPTPESSRRVNAQPTGDPPRLSSRHE